VEQQRHRIFVTNNVGHDLEKAKKFGDVYSVLFEGTQNIFDRGRMEVDYRIKLKDFNTETDLLLLSGAVVLSGYCMGLLLSWYGKAPVLIWNPKRKRYEKQIWRT